jgi:hypothetical protein
MLIRKINLHKGKAGIEPATLGPSVRPSQHAMWKVLSIEAHLSVIAPKLLILKMAALLRDRTGDFVLQMQPFER